MASNDNRYDLLKKHLRAQAASRVPMKFSDVETVINRKLPRSAKFYRMWWSNNASNHVQARAWLEAGYRTEDVDMEKEKLVFVKANSPPGLGESPSEYAGEKVSLHPLIGWMKGTFTIEEGVDLTKPAMDPEELEAMEENLDRTAELIQSGMRNKPK